MALKIHTEHGSFEVKGPLLVSLSDGSQIKLSANVGGIEVQNMTIGPAQIVHDGQVLFGKQHNITLRRCNRITRPLC